MRKNDKQARAADRLGKRIVAIVRELEQGQPRGWGPSYDQVRAAVNEGRRVPLGVDAFMRCLGWLFNHGRLEAHHQPDLTTGVHGTTLRMLRTPARGGDA